MPVNDDWRLEIDFPDERMAGQLAKLLQAPELEHDLSGAFQDRVIVSRDGATVFLYSGSRLQAERGRQVVDRLSEEQGWQVREDLRRWHPLAEEWEDPEEPLPADAAGRESEHEALIEKEREETAARGYPEFEVRVDLPSHHDAAALAGRLREEGLPAVHRWKFLLVGATDEDAARELAARIKGEAPPGSTATVEGTWRAVAGEQPRNPFAFLGGLGG